MQKPADGHFRTAAHRLWTLGLILSLLVGEGGAVQVFGEAGQRVSLPCLYHYEDASQLSQLSVQWRSPTNALLCHFIKHKSFTNCSDGYAISYQPANITLHVLHAHKRDYGTHVCSVSKPHQFSDYRVELSQTTESAPSAPNTGVKHSASCRTILLLLSLTLFPHLQK